jgi:hypothetical protein
MVFHMKKLNFILPICGLLFSLNLIGAEADNFTAASLNIVDVKDDVNALANNYLKTALNNLNKDVVCTDAGSEERLYNELSNYFANHSKGKLVKEILYTDNIQKNTLPLKESIYGNWTIREGFLLGRKKAGASPLALSPLIKIGDHIIGVDKLEHMFGMGFTYFTKHYSKKKSITDVLKYGGTLEKTILGGNVLATGVFSYADLSANFNGMRFWNHILQKNDDILGSQYNFGPYVVCKDNKWKVSDENPIDFSNYVDASFDESINCSKLANKSGLKKFKKSLIDRGFAGCPLDPEKLSEVKTKYNVFNIEHFIINKKGNGTVSYFNEF